MTIITRMLAVTVHCHPCGHQWDIRVPTRLKEFCKELRRHADEGCPVCGANGPAILVGPAVLIPVKTDA